jgi:hypothetical protein
LLLVLVQHAFRRRQLEYFDRRIDGPAVRLGAVAELDFSFSQRDIDAGFSRGRAGHQELQRQRRLAGAGIAFDQMQSVACKAAAQDVIETVDARGGSG